MSTPKKPEKAEIVGGPRDGEVVDYVGIYLYEPILRPCEYTTERQLLLSYETRRYVAHRWIDPDRHPDGYVRYVLYTELTKPRKPNG